MIQRSGGKGQEVNSHLADEVLPEHGGCGSYPWTMAGWRAGAWLP